MATKIRKFSKDEIAQAKALIRGTITQFKGKRVDEIAVALYNGLDDEYTPVRKAVCGDMRKCALAQFFANALNTKGMFVTVDTDTVTVSNNPSYEEHPNEFTFDVVLPTKLSDFVYGFDSGNYAFLQGK